MLHLPVTLQVRVGKNRRDVDDAELSQLIQHQQRRMVIVGAPGSGKSNLCARVMTRVAEAALLPGARIVPLGARGIGVHSLRDPRHLLSCASTSAPKMSLRCASASC